MARYAGCTVTRFDVQTPRPKPRINPISVDAPHIVEWIEAREPRAIANWQDLGAQEYGRAFTAAGTMGYDVIRDLYDGLISTLRGGGGEDDYAERMLPVLRDKGWLPQLDDEALGRRVRLIYDTNLRLSQAVGKWNAAQRTKQYLPYARYSAVMDRRTRPSHAALHGIVRPIDDYFWSEAWPPCGFQCRCIVTQLTRSQVARYGGVTTDEKATRALAAAHALSKNAGDFWSFNPGLNAATMANEQVDRVNDRRLPGSDPAPNRVAAGVAAWAQIFSQVADKLFNPGE